MALTLELDPGDVVHIGNGTTIKLERKTGQRARLSIKSDYKITQERGDSKPPRPASNDQTGIVKRPIPRV